MAAIGGVNAFGSMAATRCRIVPPCGTITAITILSLHRIADAGGQEDQ
jgi:hypothetical protein